MMPTCCVRSFVNKGVREAFRPGDEGDEHRCEVCGRRYVLHTVWTEAPTRPAPLHLTDDDALIH